MEALSAVKGSPFSGLHRSGRLQDWPVEWKQEEEAACCSLYCDLCERKNQEDCIEVFDRKGRSRLVSRDPPLHGVKARRGAEEAVDWRCPLVNVRLRLQRLLLPVLLVCRDAQIHAPAQGVGALPKVVDALFFPGILL